MRLKLKITAMTVALALLATAGAATAAVYVYSNNFKGRASFKALKKFDGGKSCEKSFAGKKQRFRIDVKKGPLQCDFTTPVIGDGKEPDHLVEAKIKVIKKLTAKSVRKKTYVGVGVRADKSSRYELRVFPQTKEWVVRRSPERNDFPLEGTDADIRKIGKSNKLKLRVFGDKVTAIVNKTTVVDEFTDPNPGQVGGRKTTVLAGHDKKNKKDAAAFVEQVRIAVP